MCITFSEVLEKGAYAYFMLISESAQFFVTLK